MRAKSVVYTRQKKKKMFRLAKGYYSNKNNRWRITIQQIEKSLRHAYRDRKDRKATFRQLWIVRLNAAAREQGMSYSKFMSGLRKANVLIDRKMLAEMAVNDAASFKQLADIAKAGLTA
jgi:large subunit ribosomal protein L20